MDATTGGISDIEWGDMVMKVTEPGNLFVEGEGTTTYRFLAIPTEEVANRTMLLWLDGEYVTVPLPATVWEAGQQYTYTLVVDKNHNVLVTEGEIVPWENNTQEEITVGDDNYVE